MPVRCTRGILPEEGVHVAASLLTLSRPGINQNLPNASFPFTLLKITQKFGSWFLSYQKNLLFRPSDFPPHEIRFPWGRGDQTVACMGRDIIHVY